MTESAIASSQEQDSILLFSFTFPPDHGGIARLCGEIATHLAISGHRICILRKRSAGASHYSDQCSEIVVPSMRVFREFAVLWKLLSARRSRNVICARWYPEAAIALLAGMRNITILAHGLELRKSRRPMWGYLKKILMKYILDNASIVLANSAYTAQLVRHAAPGAKVIAATLAVDVTRFHPGPKELARQRFNIGMDRFVLLTVARVHRHKGHALIFHAIARLPAEIRENIVFMIAGIGPHMNELMQEAIRIGVSQYVEWTGYIDEADLPELYRCADIFLLCSSVSDKAPEVEGFGLVLLEAQASGIPVVGTRSGGIPEAVMGNVGNIIVNNNDVMGIQKAIVWFYENRTLLNLIGLRAREMICRHFSWPQYISRLCLALGLVVHSSAADD